MEARFQITHDFDADPWRSIKFDWHDEWKQLPQACDDLVTVNAVLGSIFAAPGPAETQPGRRAAKLR